VTVSVTANDDEPVGFSARAAFTVGDAGTLTPSSSATAPATTVGTDQSGDPTLLISALHGPDRRLAQGGPGAHDQLTLRLSVPHSGLE
jgi:hypothetical protein